MTIRKPERAEQVAALLRKIEKRKTKEPVLKLAVDNTKKKKTA